MQPQGIKTKVTALYCIPFIFAHPSQRGMASNHRIIAREQRSACGQKRGGVHRVEWFRAWPYWGDPQGLKYTFKIIQYKTMIKYSLWLSAGLEEYENVFPCFRFIWALAPVLIIISWALWPRKQLFVIFCKLKIFFHIAELITWDSVIKLCVNSRGLLKPIYDRTHIYSNTAKAIYHCSSIVSSPEYFADTKSWSSHGTRTDEQFTKLHVKSTPSIRLQN